MTLTAGRCRTRRAQGCVLTRAPGTLRDRPLKDSLFVPATACRDLPQDSLRRGCRRRDSTSRPWIHHGLFPRMGTGYESSKARGRIVQIGTRTITQYKASPARCNPKIYFYLNILRPAGQSVAKSAISPMLTPFIRVLSLNTEAYIRPIYLKINFTGYPAGIAQDGNIFILPKAPGRSFAGVQFTGVVLTDCERCTRADPRASVTGSARKAA